MDRVIPLFVGDFDPCLKDEKPVARVEHLPIVADDQKFPVLSVAVPPARRSYMLPTLAGALESGHSGHPFV